MTDFTSFTSDLLNLEDSYYQQGHALGQSDGQKAGRLEGRLFGLEKGFEKYVEMGRIQGRSRIWNSRHPVLTHHIITSLSAPNEVLEKPAKAQDEAKSHEIIPSTNTTNLKSLAPSSAPNTRLEKHLRVLYALSEPISLSTDNSEEAVSDFDDRMRRALGKIKILEKIIGENVDLGMSDAGLQSGAGGGGSGGNIEDVDVLKARH